MRAFLLLYILLLVGCSSETGREQSMQLPSIVHQNSEEEQLEIIKEHLGNALQYPLYSQQRQMEIDKGLAKDSTIAYLWQQKAMPLFKQGKYEIGMDFVDRAVKYDPDRWQDYRAFIKCIFAKTYREAIADFQDCKSKRGNLHVMDHTYNFYIALSHLQLNEFEAAERYLQAEFDSIIAMEDSSWLHHLDLFYLGISKFELGKREEAVKYFDLALERYPQFSDVQYFKARCLLQQGDTAAATNLRDLAKENAAVGYTINEDNVVYERYPYQVRWR